MASSVDTYKEVGAAPLPGDAPDPAWVRDESPEFARLNAEIAKFESLSGNEIPDWYIVVETAAELIKTKSKDLLAVSYLGRGLFERASYEGLAVALQVLADVVERFWETAYPPARRAKRRGNEVAWLLDKLVHPVTQAKPDDMDRAAVLRATELVVALEQTLRAKLQEHAPPMRELREVLVGYRDKLVARETEEAARQAAEQAKVEASAGVASGSNAGTISEGQMAPARSAAAPTVAPPVSAPEQFAISSDADIRKAVKGTRQAVQQIAAYWRSRKLSDPRPYAIVRYAAWMDVAASPATELPGPTKNQVNECKRLLGEGSFRELIEFAESIVLNPDAPPNCHWLDGHRYTAAALAALGPEYDSARRAVLDAVRHYLASFPDVLDKKFNTEVDYADAQTKAWIQTEVMAGVAVGSSVGGTAKGAGGDADSVAEVVSEARNLTAKGDNRAAVAAFQRRVGSAGSARQAFSLTLEQARFCAELGYNEIASSLLEGLCEKIDYHHLEQWEPELSVETIRLLLRTMPRATAGGQAKVVELQSRLARLDAVAAMEATRKS